MDKHTNKWTKKQVIRQQAFDSYLARVNSYFEHLTATTKDNQTSEFQYTVYTNQGEKPIYKYYFPLDISVENKIIHAVVLIEKERPFVFKRPKTPPPNPNCKEKSSF